MKIFVFLLLILSANTFAVEITGELETEQKDGTSYSIQLNQTKTNIESRNFKLQVPESDYYQLTIKADGFYPALQTYSHYELAQSDFKLPKISLVKKKPNRVMLAFGGDVMMGRRYADPHLNEKVLIRDGHEAEDTKKIVAYVKPYMEIADYAAVNLETQISVETPKERAPKGVTFFSPPETLGALKWAGIDYVTLGNNHVYDYLDEGLISTLKYLKEYDMAFSGAGLNQTEALRAYQTKINRQDYSMLGFVGWEGGFTPTQTATKIKGGSALGSKQNIIDTVTKESAQNRTTIVQYHGSLEYTNEPTAMTESRLKTAIDKGADLAIAHHPHVTQGFELYNGKLIAYSMGNFIFDQYFHSTPHSFVLYVWMDGEEFHRAEIVPIYIKGYVPIPATGIERNTITKRVNFLSGLRGLNSELSGGHIVLTADTIENKQNQKLNFAAGESLKPLYAFPVNGEISKVNSSENVVNNNRYRLGKNLINGGDFESYTSYDSDERGWELSGMKVVNTNSKDGKHSLQLVSDNGVATAGMKTFRRVFKAGNPMSYQASLLTNKDVTAKLYFQRRKTRDKLSQGFKNKPVLLGEQTLNANPNWQQINFEFNTPRVGYRSYRIWVELTVKSEPSKTESQIFLDQVALVEWQAHYNSFGELPRNQEVLGLSTYLGLETPTKEEITVEVDYK